MMRIIAIILIVLLLLSGCGEKTDTDLSGTDSIESQAENDKGFSFKYNNITVRMNARAESVITALGEPMDYFEAPSCAFQGMDKHYNYGSFEISTYELNDTDYIFTVVLLDDTVSAENGVYIGCSLSELLEAYGDDYTAEGRFYNYTSGDSTLQFIVDEDIVSGINYLAILD